MKKLMLLTALATLVSGAYAADITVPATNGTYTTVMVVPPILDTATWAQVPQRGSAVVVNAGSVYRIGRQLIVAAHAGTMTNEMVTVTAYYTNGIAVDLTGAQYAATNATAVYTNSYVTVAPITVPLKGLSIRDGTVEWYRVRSADQDDVKVQLKVGGTGSTVTLSDGLGDTLNYTADATVELPDYTGALYISKTSTNVWTAKTLTW